jgi:heterotetrameric sarcosine oxidase gamma subunit
MTKEHPLSSFMKLQSTARTVAPCVQVTLEPFRAHVNVRGNPRSTDFVNACTTLLGQGVPQPGRVTRADHSCYWLGPEEFLVVSKRFTGRELVTSLSDAFAGLHAAATDLSGGQMLMTVSGSAASAFLSKASTLDLHESVFAVDDCAQSTFAKASALFALRSDEPVFELVIRRSFADYAARWMVHAGQEFGIVFAQ